MFDIFLSIAWLQVGMLSMLIILALISDIKTYKIKNYITIPFIVVGLGINLAGHGIEGLRSALGGIFFPFILLFILYALRMLGAGDIKLFCAIGAIMGLKFVLNTMVGSFIAGGMIALGVMAVQRNGRERITYLYRYLRTCILCFSLLPYTEFSNKSDGAKFRFSYAIFCGVTYCLLRGALV